MTVALRVYKGPNWDCFFGCFGSSDEVVQGSGAGLLQLCAPGDGLLPAQPLTGYLRKVAGQV